VKTAGRPGYIHPDVIIQPKLNASLGAEYGFGLSSGATLTPRLDWAYQGKRTVGNVGLAPIPEDVIGAYGLFNGRVTYQTADKDWQVSLGATNLFDKFYYYNIESRNTARGTRGFGVLGSPGAPRMWTFSVRRYF